MKPTMGERYKLRRRLIKNTEHMTKAVRIIEDEENIGWDVFDKLERFFRNNTIFHLFIYITFLYLHVFTLFVFLKLL